MDCPKNCRECPHGAECKGPYYGCSCCKFKKEIYEQIVELLEAHKVR